MERTKRLLEPQIDSIEDIVRQNAKQLARNISYHASMVEVCDSLHNVFKHWSKERYQRNRWSRAVTFMDVCQTLYCYIKLSSNDSLPQTIEIFEAIESVLESIRWTGSSDNNEGRDFDAQYGQISIHFKVSVVHTESCNIVPIYETQRVRVGSKVVCG